MNGSKKRERDIICQNILQIPCTNTYDTSCKFCFQKFCIGCARGCFVKIDNKLVCRKHTEQCFLCLNSRLEKVKKDYCYICTNQVSCSTANCGIIEDKFVCMDHSFSCNTLNCQNRSLNTKIRGEYYCRECYNSYKTGIECLMLKFKYKCNYRDMVNYTLKFLL